MTNLIDPSNDEVVEPSTILRVVYAIPTIKIIRPQFVIEEERALNIKRGEYIEMHNNQRQHHIEKLAIARQKRMIKKALEMAVDTRQHFATLTKGVEDEC